MARVIDQCTEGFGYRDPRRVLPKQFGAHLDMQAHKFARGHLTDATPWSLYPVKQSGSLLLRRVPRRSGHWDKS